MLTLKTTATFSSVEEFSREKGKFISFVYLTDFQPGGTEKNYTFKRSALKSPVPKASLVAQRAQRLPAVQKTRVQSLGWEDPLEKEMVMHSSILAWRISWTEEPGRLTVHSVAKSWT